MGVVLTSPEQTQLILDTQIKNLLIHKIVKLTQPLKFTKTLVKATDDK